MEDYDSENDERVLRDFTNELNCQKFVKTDVWNVTCFFLYLDDSRHLRELKKTDLKLTIPNTLLKQEISNIVKTNSSSNNTNHKLVYFLKYNFNIDESDLKNMHNYCFLDTIDYINDVSFHPTIEIMQNINSMFFVYLENSVAKKTKKRFHSPMKKTNKSFH